MRQCLRHAEMPDERIILSKAISVRLLCLLQILDMAHDRLSGVQMSMVWGIPSNRSLKLKVWHTACSFELKVSGTNIRTSTCDQISPTRHTRE
jgi:hypothetical protein